MRARLYQYGAHDIVLRSAGTWARGGDPMYEYSLDVLADRGIDGTAFRTTPLDEHTLAGVDVVIGAAREHRAAAVGMRPALLKSAFTLPELSRICADIDARELTATSLDARLMRLVQLAASRRTNTLPADPEDDDLVDPIGLPPEEFVVCADTVEALLDPIVTLLTAS